jgi:diguanylate cyclase (GGDEF)-like protein
MTGALAVRQLVSIQEGRRRAVVDPVTRLANRAGLMEVLERAHARSARSEQQAAVLLLDLDGFKGINDQYGHEVGDEALIAFGNLLRRCVLGSDLVGRLGGDEFVIVLGRLDSPQDAEAVAQRILTALEVPLSIGGMLLQLRTSIGIASIHGDGDTPKDSLARADQAMYAAKRQSGSRWVRDGVVAPAGTEQSS